VNLVDANVLLYAVNTNATNHVVSRGWLDGALNGHEGVGLAWGPILAFVRLSTRRDVFPAPLTIPAALARVRAWMGQPPAVVLEPTRQHLDIIDRLLASVGAGGGNLVNDAHLAALSIEHRATIVTFDNDFGRFPGVRWRNPGS